MAQLKIKVLKIRYKLSRKNKIIVLSFIVIQMIFLKYLKKYINMNNKILIKDTAGPKIILKGNNAKRIIKINIKFFKHRKLIYTP